MKNQNMRNQSIGLQKMTSAEQQKLKNSIAARLKAASNAVSDRVDSVLSGKKTEVSDEQPHDDSHVMPDGSLCTDMNKSSYGKAVTNQKREILKNGFIMAEVLSEPMCKKRHKRGRI
jgi:hypothetical protein